MDSRIHDDDAVGVPVRADELYLASSKACIMPDTTVTSTPSTNNPEAEPILNSVSAPRRNNSIASIANRFEISLSSHRFAAQLAGLNKQHVGLKTC